MLIVNVIKIDAALCDIDLEFTLNFTGDCKCQQQTSVTYDIDLFVSSKFKISVVTAMEKFQ